MTNHQRSLVVSARLAALLYVVGAFGAAPVIADTLPIVSYSMENGDLGFQTYFDDTYGGPGATGNPSVAGSFLSGGLGQLTNGLFASDTDIFDDEWIGWVNVQPTITIDLGTAKFVNAVSLHASNHSPPGNDVGVLGSANLSYSIDNVTYTPLGSYATTDADRSGDLPRWVDVPFGVTARYARVQLHDGFKVTGTSPGFKPWVFLDEVRVDGSTAPPGNSLLAYWNAENGAADVTGNGHDGVFQGNAATTTGGPFGNAFTFDGSGDYITIGDELDMGTSNFTLAAWIKGDPTMNQWGRIFDKGYFSGYAFGRRSFSNAIGFEMLASNPDYGTASSLVDNEWHHVALVKSGSTATIYADGVAEGSNTVSLANQSNALPLLIGFNPGEGIQGFWRGQLDELKIFNRALAPAEIAALASLPGFSFADFSSTAGLQFRGSAVKAGNALRLSTAAPYNAGTVFTVSPVALANDKSFNTHFQFRITNSAGANDEDGVGADGLLFAVQTATTGGGIGYSNQGLGIEFDTFNNGAAFGDPNGNHVGIDLNGSIISVQTQGEPVRFNNGAIWNAWVDYNGATDQLEVRWSMNSSRPAVAQLTRTVDLAALLGQNNTFVGFTSATGGGWGDHELLSWEFFGGSLPANSFTADYDGNDRVNAIDLEAWKAGFGASPSATHLQGDGDGDGDADGNDFLIWQRLLNAPSALAVPEPAARALALIALLGSPGCRPRRVPLACRQCDAGTRLAVMSRTLSRSMINRHFPLARCQWRPLGVTSIHDGLTADQSTHPAPARLWNIATIINSAPHHTLTAAPVGVLESSL
jgi:hypothetical protein